MTVRILSLNAGLLKLFGRSLPTPFVEERLAALPDRLRSVECDLVLLQEIYGGTRRRRLAEKLRDTYPFAICPRKKRNFGLENGLMWLSRHPAEGEVELFTDAPADEALFDSKGFMVVRCQLSPTLTLNVINLHTTAGGIFKHPEDQRTDILRSRQLRRVLDRAGELPSPLILAGDFNAGPGVSEVNFRQVLNAGFISVHDMLGARDDDATWHPQNPLNSNGPHKACPPQRIDHIFVRSEDLSKNRLRPLDSQICLGEPVVQLPHSRIVSVSDHFGLLVRLEITSALQQAPAIELQDRQYQAP